MDTQQALALAFDEAASMVHHQQLAAARELALDSLVALCAASDADLQLALAGVERPVSADAAILGLVSSRFSAASAYVRLGGLTRARAEAALGLLALEDHLQAKGLLCATDRLCHQTPEPAPTSESQRVGASIIAIGSSQSGKTTLAAAISWWLHRELPTVNRHPLRARHSDGDLPAFDPNPYERYFTPWATTVRGYRMEYATARHAFAHYDSPGKQKYLPNVLRGMAFADVVLVVIDPARGIDDHSKTLLTCAKALGATHVVGFINNHGAADSELSAIAVIELSEALASRGFDPNSPAVEGSALTAYKEATSRGSSLMGAQAVRSLIATLDRPSYRDYPDGPARLYVDRCFAIYGRGTVVTGRLVRGPLQLGDQLELRGYYPTQLVRVKEIQRARISVPLARSGEWVSVLCYRAGKLRTGAVPHLRRHVVRRGQALVTQNTVKLAQQIRVLARVPSPREHGPPSAIRSGYCAQFFIEQVVVMGEVQVEGALEPRATPTPMTVILQYPVLLEPGAPFVALNGRQIALIGTVEELTVTCPDVVS